MPPLPSTLSSRQAWSDTGRRMLTHPRVLAAVIVISISALVAIDQYGGRMASDASHRLDLLTVELASIPPPPGLTLYKQTNQTKPGQALTSREYVGATSYGAARTYYDAVLADRASSSYEKPLAFNRPMRAISVETKKPASKCRARSGASGQSC